MRFKVGDKVRVKDFSVLCKEFGVSNFTQRVIGGITFVEDMKQYCGNVFTVKDTDIACNCYYLESAHTECGYHYNFSVEVLEPFSPMYYLKSGCMVKLNNGDRYLVLIDDDQICLMNLNGKSSWSGWTNKANFDIDVIEKIYAQGLALENCETATEVIWSKMPEPKKMTVDEISKALGYSVEVIS